MPPYIAIENTGTFGEYGWVESWEPLPSYSFAYIGFDAVSTAAQKP